MKQRLLLISIWISAGMLLTANCHAAGGDPNSPVEVLSNGVSRALEANETYQKPKLVKDSIIEKYGAILKKYVDADGNVDYKNLRKKRRELISLEKELEQLHPLEMMSWSEKEKIAFWINAHNIFTISLVIDNYPIKPKRYMIFKPKNSVIHIPGGRNKIYFKVQGLEYTLEEIEKGILLEGYQEPLIAFALSHATKGSAFLLNEPYTAEKLDDQLKKQASKMLNDKRGMIIKKNIKTIYLTDIFNWYKPQFVKKYGHIKRFRNKNEHIRSYLNCILNHVPQETSRYLINNDYTVKFQNYNWQLNEQAEK